MRFIISAVCAAWLPEPTSKFTSGWAGQIREKIAGKKFVVVLPGMHETVFDIGRILQRLNDWRNFHKIGPCPNPA